MVIKGKGKGCIAYYFPMMPALREDDCSSDASTTSTARTTSTTGTMVSATSTASTSTGRGSTASTASTTGATIGTAPLNTTLLRQALNAYGRPASTASTAGATITDRPGPRTKDVGTQTKIKDMVHTFLNTGTSPGTTVNHSTSTETTVSNRDEITGHRLRFVNTGSGTDETGLSTDEVWVIKNQLKNGAYGARIFELERRVGITWW